jgi:hypothetical protein
MAKRGQLTPEIQQRAKELLSIELTQKELRLMPFVQHNAMNEGFIDRQRINAAELEILGDWEFLGFGDFIGNLSITKAFWDAMSELVWLGYVDYANQREAQHG